MPEFDINPPKGVKLSKDQQEFLKKVKELAKSCINCMEKFYPFHNKWEAHSNKVKVYFEKFVKIAELTITEKEWTVLIAACILHDIGKALPVFHPSFQSNEPDPLSFASEVLDEVHHVITFIFLLHIINKNLPIVSDTKIKVMGDEIDQNYRTLTQIIDSHPDWKQYLQCVAWISLLHKQMSTKLLQTFSTCLCEIEPSNKDILSYWSDPEKLFHLFKEKKESNTKIIKEWLLKGEEQKLKKSPKNRFQILSALLNFGDKLDISYDRLQEQPFYLAVLLDDIGIPRTYKEFPHPDAMARWFQFKYTQRPEIINDSKKNGTNIKAVIKYLYPGCLKEEFPFFRYQAEKDFEDLFILSVLEEAIQEEKGSENIRLSIQRNEKKSQDIRGLQHRNERLLYCLQKICDERTKEKISRLIEDYFTRVGILYLKREKEFFPCNNDEKNPSSKCVLLELVYAALEEDAHASYPDWQNFTIKKPGKLNLRRIICKKEAESIKDKDLTEDEKNMREYLEKISAKKVMLCLSPRARDGLEEWKKNVAVERKDTDLQGALFYPYVGHARRIPVSMDVAYLLNLFRHLGSEPLSVDDIVNLSGLDRGRILMYCGRLEHEGFIMLDHQVETYQFNRDKYEEIEKILKPFDYRRSELVAKVRDIERFGRPLALCSDLNETSLVTDIEGLDQVLAPFEKKETGLPLRKSILLLGPPGSGKTTFALEIVRNVRLKRFPEETALYLTFEEDTQRLLEDFDGFGWTRGDIAACVRSLSTLRRKTYLENPDQFLNGFLGILDEFAPDFVAVDNVGYLLQLVPLEASREILNRLIRVFTVRGITSLLVGEDVPGRMSFEAYDVDGVIILSYEGGKRWLEITKIRGREFASGRHPFRIAKKKKISKQGIPSGELSIQVFPNIQMHIAKIERDKDKNKSSNGTNNIKETLSSGIKGLNDLLPISTAGGEKKNGFEPGEIILVLGSPGAGKTLMGLHFLKEGWEKKEKGERILWISFESDLSGLKLATRSFSSEAKFDQLIADMDPKSNNESTRFYFFSPAQLDPDELVNFLLKECDEENGEMDRIVLDSVTDLEQIFKEEIDFKVFMTSMVQLLREKGITTMFLYRAKEFFGKTEDIGRVLASVVDTIICLKVLEIQNAVQKGLFLLKVRGREHLSKLLSVTFDEKQGMVVSDRGWTMSGLISGETGEIREPRVFVKLFFENSNEILINSLIVHEYNRRFKGVQTRFVQVRKPQIYSEFWSFRGSSGAGHANVRVVSLCDYWATLFHKQNKLYNLWAYVSSETRQLVRRDEFWRRCASYSYKEHTFNIFAIPNYIDVGVLAFHENITKLDKFWHFVGIDKPKDKDFQAARKGLSKLTWKNLNPKGKTFEEIKEQLVDLSKKHIIKGEKPLKYLFAMPDLSDTSTFISFFLEIFWSFGGVIFDFRQVFNEYVKYCEGFLDESNSGSNLSTLYRPPLKTSPRMQFVGEILLLIPERVLNRTIKKTNKKYPNFVGDICRHGEVLLDTLLKHKGIEPSNGEKAYAVDDIKNPIKILKTTVSNDEKTDGNSYVVLEFVKELLKEFEHDKIWKGQQFLRNAALTAKEYINKVLNSNDEQDKKNLLLSLFYVLSRIVTSRERYEFLLEWLRDRSKKEDSESRFRKEIDNLISIGPENTYALNTVGFMVELIKSGLTPNPYMGDLSDQSYLARKWSGDLAQKHQIASLKDVADALDLHSPPEAYLAYEEEKNETYRLEKKRKNSSRKRGEKIESIKKTTSYHIAPLPSCEREEKEGIPGGKWSYAVLGLWQLGITSPAVSPEIGWIFIDALTEDKFVEMRAKRGLGMPAKVSAYNRTTICSAQPEIYGRFKDDGKLEENGEGITQLFRIATKDKPQEDSNMKDVDVEYCTRERTTTPYYYKIEGILGKEFQRLFEPSFFDTHIKNDNRKKLLKGVLRRIKSRTRNFLIKKLWSSK